MCLQWESASKHLNGLLSKSSTVNREAPTISKRLPPFLKGKVLIVLCTLSFLAFAYHIRTILVSVKFLSAILGPEMAAPILWAPGKIAFFLQEDLHVHKIPRFRGGGGYFGLGGEVPISFLWAQGFF